LNGVSYYEVKFRHICPAILSFHYNLLFVQFQKRNIAIFHTSHRLSQRIIWSRNWWEM